jgi:hypothetical protein
MPDISGLIAAPLLRCTGLRALRRECLHPPSHRCFHSHSLGGYGEGGPRRRASVDLIYLAVVAAAAEEQRGQ